MNIPRGDWFGYREMHTLKEEYKKECGFDLFLTCFNMDRSKNFINRGEYVRDKMSLQEDLPQISDSYLIDLCNECLCYDNLSALEFLIAEVTKRNASRDDGSRILFFKENVK